MRDLSFVSIPAVMPLVSQINQSDRPNSGGEELIKPIHSLLCRPLRTGFDVADVSLRRDCDSNVDSLMRLRRQQNTLRMAAEMRGSHLREESARSAA
jgi:hypothetical protein